MVFKSGEVQTSVMTAKGFSFPISPAGIVRVVRTPLTNKPSIVWVPRSSVLTSALSSWPRDFITAIVGGGTGDSPAATAPNCWMKTGPPAAELAKVGGPLGIGIFCAFLLVKSRVYDTWAIGSMMTTKRGAFAGDMLPMVGKGVS